MIIGSGVWVCVFPEHCNCVKFLFLNEEWMVLPVIFFEFVEVIGILGDSSMLPLLF